MIYMIRKLGDQQSFSCFADAKGEIFTEGNNMIELLAELKNQIKK